MLFLLYIRDHFYNSSLFHNGSIFNLPYLLYYSGFSFIPASPVIPDAGLQRLIVICIIIGVVLIAVTVAPSLAVKIQINI